MLNGTSIFMLHILRPSYMYNNPFLCCMPPYSSSSDSFSTKHITSFKIQSFGHALSDFEFMKYFGCKRNEIIFISFRTLYSGKSHVPMLDDFFFFDSPKVKSYKLIIYKCTHKVASIIRYWILKKFYCTGERQTCIRFTILKKRKGLGFSWLCI